MIEIESKIAVSLHEVFKCLFNKLTIKRQQLILNLRHVRKHQATLRRQPSQRKLIRRVPFDQKFCYVKWNGIFYEAEVISFYSHLSTFPIKNYSTKC